jgi:hypothetical protein
MSEWYANIQGKQEGPVSLEEIVSWIQKGTIKAGDWVYPPGATDWILAENVPELASALQAASNPAPTDAKTAEKKLTFKKVESAPPPVAQAPAGGLQFDRAETTKPLDGPAACTVCKKTIDKTYYEANGQVICAECHEKAKASLAGGSGFLRFLKACLFGTVAAVVGGGIEFAVAYFTERIWSLIAIVVALMVGGAVRFGSENRGGWLYQIIAIFLTYCAIVVSYIPALVKEMDSPGDTVKAQPVATTPAKTVATTTTNAPPAAAAKESDEDSSKVFRDAIHGRRGPVGTVVAWIILFVMAFALPILAGFSSPIGLLIIGIGLYQAWAMTKRAVVELTGPFSVGPPATNAPPAV